MRKSIVFLAMILALLLTLTVGYAETGTCGDGLTWTFDMSTSTLTISGTGKMAEFT